MNTATALLQSDSDDDAGFVRRVGRALLGSAAILIVGAGALPAADAAAAGVAGGPKLVSAAHSTHESHVSPSALPAESSASAARFAVGADGTLTRLD